ncbi:protein-methionine-sulfoxide reductase catalytic subunit MsrP [Algicella marina]|uniref:Protein-methionine-sulfoxide reductase catalytic subunit MsrP n=1 Tax=Algicella marina TaxID=2683284 RepID=A0A6P1T6A2_9RHOB|nr:protein-methionine-sulfoxide reductase catalytic subunit MsrP [Algicella marina]QHQ36102.1 protein-methionine-sulfoxide reductase catalytic subunit MsrP [Algicella marina]
MLINTAPKIRSSEITPKAAFLNRRALLAGTAGAIAGAAVPRQAVALDYVKAEGEPPAPLTAFEEITSYNNFYEFGLRKEDPKRYAGELTTDPWSVKIDGMVGRPGDYALEDLLKPSVLEERVYRFRCVEAWAMVVPWIGIPLADVIARAEPQSSAKYVAFETLVRPEEMRGQRGFQSLEWPYREGLRLDEAMNPLTILANGLYGEELPNQNGAPLRLVVPWKYGFKSIKSIVRITLTDRQPPTTWNMTAASEYGFYSNVNPEVDHPRWSQAKERVVGSGLFAGKQDTLLFNGYADEVGSLYAGMDLHKNF